MAHVVRQPCDEGLIRSKEATSACTSNAAPWILAATILGIGLSILVPAVTAVTLNSVDVRHEALASAINNAFSQTAGLLAVAVLGVLMFVSFGSSLDNRLATVDLPHEARQQLQEEKVKLGAAEAPENLDPTLNTQVERAIDEAFVSGYRVVMLVATAMAPVSAISATLLIKTKKPKGDDEEAQRTGGETAPA